MNRILCLGITLFALTGTLHAQETKVPAWNARGVGPLPRQGITCIDVSDDGKEVVVGTIAAFGDPNVIVLDDAGKIVRHYHVGQQWIDSVAFLPGSKDVLAVCTMPAGKAGDRVEAFRCQGKDVTLEKLNHDCPWFFHYGDYSNHPTMKLARRADDKAGATALLSGNQLVIYRRDKQSVTLRVPVSDPDASVSLAIDEHGWAIVGTTSRGTGNNLYLFDPDKQKPVWSRPVNKEVAETPKLEKGKYGTPTLPDGTRAELPQRDEKVWAPLSVAIHTEGAKKLIAVADYQGWQRWVRSSATMKDDNQGLRFVPAKPTITVYSEIGKRVTEFPDAKIQERFWCDLQFSKKAERLSASQHAWACRGLAGTSLLPTDNRLDVVHVFYRDKVIIVADGPTYVGDQPIWSLHWTGLTASHPDGKRWFEARLTGVIRFRDDKYLHWQTDLNKDVPKSPKPWLANARATPIVPGVWQIPGGRVESDLGGQRLIEAPDGYVLIEGHAGLSFEREWAAMEAVGLDPRKVKYVLATHEHGDHAPGAYLWRVVTGAKFVCSEEMAYTLQHHIPGNTGYGLHPPVPTDIVVTKDTELDLAGLKVRAIRIPGHTAGSMAWHFEKSGKTFVAFGDLIMPKGVLGYSGSVNFSATDALASLRKLRDLKPDYVLPGHGAVEGPANYLQAGIDVGTRVGWGFIKPERPDPRFRLTQKNVHVVGWGQGATSAACGDLDGDGKPDVAIVAPDGDGSIVKIYLNHAGKFNDEPDHAIKVPTVSQPHKLRITPTKTGPHILVAGKSAAVLTPEGKFPGFQVTPVDFSEGNHLRFLDDGTPMISRRFGGFFALDLAKAKPTTTKFVPEIDGPYVDFRMVGKDLLTAYGQLYRRGADGKFGAEPVLRLPVDKDWNSLAVGDFNGDGKPDVAFLSYQGAIARVHYHRGDAGTPYAAKDAAPIALGELLTGAKKGQTPPLVRDTPIVADWNGDGIDDLIVAFGQADEVLVLLGGKDGLSKDRVQRIHLEYRVHYEHGVFVGDFNGDGKPDLAVFGYTNTGVGAGGPPAVYVWLQP